MKLQGKKALVTGADSGIGQAIAITFAREGADVVVHYGTDQEGAQSTAKQAQEHGVQAHVLQADLADPQQAQQLFDQALSALGQIDILVNNAGTGGDVEQSIDQPLRLHSRNQHRHDQPVGVVPSRREAYAQTWRTRRDSA